MSYPSNNQENEFNEFNNITQDKLDSMSTAELLELLESINDTMTEDNFSDDLVSACLDALDRKSPMPDYLPTEESWHSFENKVGIDSNTGNINNTGVSVTGHKVKRVFRTGLAAAIIAFCLFSCMVVAQAAGIDVFGSIARWTDSVFWFGESGNANEVVAEPTSEIDAVQERIEFWLPDVPDDFAMGVPDVLSEPISGVVMYSVQYQSRENILLFDAVALPDDSTGSMFEKDNNTVKEVFVRDMPVYIFSNNGESVAAWHVDGIEFSISTNLDIESLESLIINSYGG